MKDIVENDASLRRKINSLARVSEKWRKKMISFSQKVSCPLAIMRSFSQNCFLLIPIILASRNYYSLFLRYSSESYFLSSGNAFLNESSNLYGGDTFSVLWKPVFLFNLFFFNKWKPSLKLVEAHYFLGKTFFPLAEKEFLSSENCFLLFRALFLQIKSVTEMS